MRPSAARRRALPALPEPARPGLLESSACADLRAHWIAGARPRTLPAAVAPVLAGTGVAAYADAAVWWKAALALVVALALQVGVNYANDYSDGIRGTDADRVGPMRLVGSGAATPGAVKARRVPRLRRRRASPGWCSPPPPRGGCSPSASVSVVAAWFYTGGSRPYGYLGARRGDGLRASSGWSRWSARRTSRPSRGAPGVGVRRRSAIGALACAILVANNLRDIPTDRVAGKRTLAVLPRRRAAPATCTSCWWQVAARRGGRASRRCTTWWALLGVFYAAPVAPAARAVLEGAQGRDLVPVLQQTGLGELLWAPGSSSASSGACADAGRRSSCRWPAPPGSIRSCWIQRDRVVSRREQPSRDKVHRA